MIESLGFGYGSDTHRSSLVLLFESHVTHQPHHRDFRNIKVNHTPPILDQNHNTAIMADGVSPAAPTTYLDEATGEQVSKSELKKRQKQREKEKQKAERVAAAPPKPVAVKKTNAEADEKELNPNVMCNQSKRIDIYTKGI
jgi:hypothetical protein